MNMVVLVKVCSVTLTWPHVVVVHRVCIVETGISLMERGCLLLLVILILLKLVQRVELNCVITVGLSYHLKVYIGVTLQLLLFMMMMTNQ